MARQAEPAAVATAEGRAQSIARRPSSGRLGARGTAHFAHGDVEAQAVAYVVGGTVAMGGFPALSLRLQALTDSGGKARGGVTAKGAPLALWEGSVAEALDLVGANGPTAQAYALRAAERRLAALRAQVVEANAPKAVA